MGPEFDALISIEKIARNTFKATVSKKAGSLNFGTEINAGYYPQESKHRLGKYWKDIYAKEDDSNYVASFELKRIEGYVSFLQVFWFPEKGGLCGAYGKSKDLVLE